MDMMKVSLYSDGAYSRSRNVGGYAYHLIYKKKNGELHTFSHSDKVESTTSNRMELTAIIEGLNKIKTSCWVEIISDSTYCVDTVNKWISSFIKDPMRQNHDLMVELYKAMKRHYKVEATWVRGHSNNETHDIVNELAQKAAGTWKEKKNGKRNNSST